MKAGDLLTLADGTQVEVTDVTFEDRHETVYNIEVADYHTYYVGEDGVWVHNRYGQQGGTAGKGSNEIILPKESTHDAARNTLLKEVEQTGAFKNGSNAYIGRLESSYGYGKQIGRQSFDGRVRWRLDFDDVVGVHYNFEDFSNGKGIYAIKKIIPIDISYDDYISILDLWN